MALGLEVVLSNLKLSNEAYVTKKGSFWKLSYEQANRVVESIYITLKSQNFPAESLPKVARDVVPINVACIDAEATSDLRDWVILQDTIKLLEFFTALFTEFQQYKHQEIVERAAFDPLVGMARHSMRRQIF